MVVLVAGAQTALLLIRARECMGMGSFLRPRVFPLLPLLFPFAPAASPRQHTNHRSSFFLSLSLSRARQTPTATAVFTPPPISPFIASN